MTSKSSFRPRKTNRDDSERGWDVGSSSPEGVNNILFATSPRSVNRPHQQSSESHQKEGILEQQSKTKKKDDTKKNHQRRSRQRKAIANASGNESETDTVLDMFDMFCWSGSSNSRTAKVGNSKTSVDDIEVSNRTSKGFWSSSILLSKKQQRHRNSKGRRQQYHRCRSCSPSRLSPTKEEEGGAVAAMQLQSESEQHNPKPSPPHQSSSRRRYKKDYGNTSNRDDDGRSSAAMKPKAVEDLLELSHWAQQEPTTIIANKSSHRNHSTTTKSAHAGYKDDLIASRRKWNSDSMVRSSTRSGSGRPKKDQRGKKVRQHARNRSPSSRRSRSVETPDRRKRHPAKKRNAKSFNWRSPGRSPGHSSSSSRKVKSGEKLARKKKPRQEIEKRSSPGGDHERARPESGKVLSKPLSRLGRDKQTSVKN